MLIISVGRNEKRLHSMLARVVEVLPRVFHTAERYLAFLGLVNSLWAEWLFCSIGLEIDEI